MSRRAIKFGSLVLNTAQNKAGYVVEVYKDFCIVKYHDNTVEKVNKTDLRILGD